MNRYLIATTAMLAAAVPQAASANPMIVTAAALDSCLVTASPMLFGSVRPGTAAVRKTANLTLVCTPNAQFDVLLNDGVNPKDGQRQLKKADGDEFIPYNLYSDAGYSTAWGNTVDTDTVAGQASAQGEASFTVYGEIPLGAVPVSAGAYADSVTVSVSF